jgi:hypothetical protein
LELHGLGKTEVQLCGKIPKDCGQGAPDIPVFWLAGWFLDIDNPDDLQDDLSDAEEAGAGEVEPPSESGEVKHAPSGSHKPNGKKK